MSRSKLFETIGIAIWVLTVVALVVMAFAAHQSKSAGDIGVAIAAGGFALGLAFIYKFRI